MIFHHLFIIISLPFHQHFKSLQRIIKNTIFAPKLLKLVAKMNISELSNLNANVSVCVTLADLKEFVSEMIVEAAAKPAEAEEKYLSVDEVCEILHVSSNTLWRWGKSGYLVPVKVGRTPQYRLSDIENLRHK